MADDIARRREIRRRKILEGSDARLKKIASSSEKKSLEKDILCHGDSVVSNTIQRNHEVDPSSSIPYRLNAAVLEEDYLQPSDNSCSVYEMKYNVDTSSTCRSRIVESNSESKLSVNGNHPRSSDYYEFPKKVSDAETRSFGRTRSDVRRNSSCTQIMMETLQFSSFCFVLLRLWLTVVTAFGLKMYFLLSNNLPIFETIFIPFLLLEVGFFSWTKYDSQISTRPVVSSLISGALLLCGFPSTVISWLNSVLNVIHLVTEDFCFYVFSFVFFHFIYEIYV